MKILCLIDSLGSGGAQRQLVGLATFLKAQNRDVLLSYYHPNHFFRDDLEIHNVEMRFIDTSNNKFSKFIGVYRLVEKYNPDIVIAYLDGACTIASILRIFKFRYKLYVSERSFTQKLDLKTRIKFYLYRWSDCIITNSYSEASNLVHKFPKLRCLITTVTNFVDTNLFVPSIIGIKKEGVIDLQVLCVARVGPEKNVIRFLYVIKKLVDDGYRINVNWYGDKGLDSHYYEICLSIISDLQLTEIVHLNPASNNIVREYQKADILCLPSLYEGYPNVICEAMSCGLPVVCSKINDNPLIVEDNIHGFLFNPLSEKDMANAFVRFINLSTKERTEMRSECREKAISLFSKDVFLKNYVELLGI